MGHGLSDLCCQMETMKHGLLAIIVLVSVVAASVLLLPSTAPPAVINAIALAMVPVGWVALRGLFFDPLHRWLQSNWKDGPIKHALMKQRGDDRRNFPGY